MTHNFADQNKTDVLPYIDGDGPMPAKYARVVIFEGGKAEPDSQEYMVGPLPVSRDTKIEKLDYIFNGGRGGSVPYNGRYVDSKRTAASNPLLIELMSEIDDITVALFDGAWYGPSDERTNLITMNTTPVSFNGTNAFLNVWFRYPGAASYMTPIDFYVILDVSGTDASKYFLRGFVTNSRYFTTATELRAAFEAGELKNEFPQTRDQGWALMDLNEEMGVRDLDHRLAPQSLEIGGKRYKMDKKEGYVEFMGWSFYMSFSRVLGVMFYDIKFKGERILYELALQEAAAQYAGYQPKASGTVYHDTYFSMGTYSATLVEGYDCPFGSTMVPISFATDGGKTETHPDAICIFEADSGFPLSRHRTASGSTGYGFSHLASVKGSALHVRHVATVDNYDYMFDYAFHVDGSMELTVRASGYLQPSAYYPDQGKFGPRIHVGTQGSYHDHILTYKADFDVIGSQNSLLVTELVVKNQTQPWWPELGLFPQMELETSVMSEEQQFNWAPNGQAMYSVISTNHNNSWGVPRGYRIIPGKSNIHLSIMDSPFSQKSCHFMKSHLAVTKQKDNEPYANSWQNVNVPMDPQQDFAKFFDGESVQDEDLVVWFNLGMHHFTRSEDVPVTLFNEAVTSISFAPQNFFDRSQDGDLLNRRWVEAKEDAETGETTLVYEDYGVPLSSQCKVEFEEPVSKIGKWTTA